MTAGKSKRIGPLGVAWHSHAYPSIFANVTCMLKDTHGSSITDPQGGIAPFANSDDALRLKRVVALEV